MTVAAKPGAPATPSAAFAGPYTTAGLASGSAWPAQQENYGGVSIAAPDQWTQGAPFSSTVVNASALSDLTAP